MKVRKLLSVLLLISVVGSAATFGIIFLTDRDSLSSGYNIKEYFDLTDVSGIVIDTNTRLAFGKIDKNERPYAEFEYKKTGITAIDPKYGFTTKKEGNSIRIALNNKMPGLVTVGRTETKLTVYLPEVKFNTAIIKCSELDNENGLLSVRDLNLNVKDDDIELTNTFEVLKIYTGDGNIRIASDIPSDLDVFTHYGDIELTGDYSVIKAQSEDGNIFIRNNTEPAVLSASTSDGNVELVIPAGISGLELNYDIYDGKLTSEFDLDTRLGEGRQKGMAYFGDRSLKVSAVTGEGNIIIRKD